MLITKEKEVLVAILAKNKEVELPLFLQCLSMQDYDKKLIHLYIRSNDNTDNTIEIIETWLKDNEELYASCYRNYLDIDSTLKNFSSHEWNSKRFNILGKIRQESIEYAKQKGLNYFVIDCDNFIKSDVLSTMISCNLPVVAPFLKISPAYRVEGREHSPSYSNYHFETDNNGYFRDTYNRYHDIYYKVFSGFIKCDVVHCTYFIKYEILKFISYLDDTERHEYVIFSDKLRRAGITQYLYNEECCGLLVLLQKDELLLTTYEDVELAD